MSLPSQQIIDAMRDMVFVMRVEQNPYRFYYELFNQVAKDVLGFTTATLNQEIEDVNPVTKATVLKNQYMEVVRKQQASAYQDDYFVSSGQKVSESVLTPIITDGIVTHIVAVVRDITAVKYAHEQTLISKKRLELSRQRYKSLFDNNTAPIGYLNLSGEIVKMNQALTTLAETIEGEGFSRNLFELLDGDSLAEVRESFYQTSQGKHCSVETDVHTKADHPMHLEIRFIPMRLDYHVHGIYVIIRDLTTEYFAKSALLESEKRFRLIAEHSSDLIQVLDQKQHFSYLSPSHTQRLHYHLDELYQKTFCDITSAAFKAAVQEVLTVISDTPSAVKKEIQLVDALGEARWFECQFESVFDVGAYVHTIVVARDIEERKAYEAELTQLAYQDPLTGLANRRLFNNRLEQIVTQFRREQTPFAVMMLDIDNFKTINDQYGHEVGDAVIVEIARRLQHVLRDVDTVARLGGDEFIILLPALATEAGVYRVIERLEQALQATYRMDDHDLSVGVSIGVVMPTAETCNVKRILNQADRALYEAKRTGKNKTIFHAYDD